MRIDLATLGGLVDLARGEAWSGERLRRAIATRAGRLGALGVRRGDRVLITHAGGGPFFADLLAAWARGACVAVIDPRLPEDEAASLAEALRPALVLVAGDSAAPRGWPRCDLADTIEAERALDGFSVAPDDPALVLFTSGSSGTPKGVVHGFAGLFARLAHNRQAVGRAALARSLCPLPTHFGHGLIGNCLTPLFAGGTVHLFGEGEARALGGLGAAIDAHRITFMSSVPALWRVALKLSRPPADESLARIHIGSAPLSEALWREVVGWAGGAEVWNVYGLTETANWVAGAPSGEGVADGLVGRPWGGGAAVLGEDGRRDACGAGEILLRTPSLMQGYLNRPDLTAMAVRDGWYHTGDLGSIDEQGRIRLAGRRDGAINRAGVMIHPEEVELMLERHPDVLEACAFAVADPVCGETVAAAVVLRPGTTTADLARWCAERARRALVPERWFTVGAIPRTDRGKLDRRGLVERFARGG